MAYMTGYPILGITSNMLQLLVVDNEEMDLHVLSYYEETHNAIKDGNLVDANELIKKIKRIFEKTNYFLNGDISTAVLVFPESTSSISKNEVFMELQSEGTEITLKHINELFRAAAKQVKHQNQSLLNVFPTSFTVSGISDIENPKGLIGQNIGVDAFSVSVPKDIFMNILYSIEQAGVQVVDILPMFYCNIIEVASTMNLKKSGTVVDIAYDYVMISIYENGVPQKTRMLKFGINGIIKILMDKYQITEENAQDLLRSSVYLDEDTAEDIVVYRLELPTGVLDITEQDLAQCLSDYLYELLSSIRDIIEYFNSYSDNPIIFLGSLLKIPGFQELVTRYFSDNTLHFYQSDVVGLREFSLSALIGCAKLIPSREQLLDRSYEYQATEDIDIYKIDKKSIAKPNNETTDTHEKRFWDKITNYFFD